MQHNGDNRLAGGGHPTLYREIPVCGRVCHRTSGADDFLLPVCPCPDAAMLRVSPRPYNAVLATYKTLIVGLMEYGLVAANLSRTERGFGSS